MGTERQLKCARCSLPLTDDNIIISPQGETFHQRCWSGPLDRLAEPRTPVVRKSEPICPVCLQPIKPSDMVTGLRDDLMHEACDYTRPKTT
jgi:hypothetical protein